MLTILTSVGFEPTRANTEDLKSSPLDHSGKMSDINILFESIISLILNWL